MAARHADRLLAAARAVGSERWIAYLEPLPDRLRDDEPARPAGDRDALPRGLRGEGFDPRRARRRTVTEPFLDSIDRLIRELNRSRG